MVELFDTDGEMTYDWLSDHSDTIVRGDRFIGSDELLAILKENQTTSFRKQKKNEFDLLRDEIGSGQKIAPNNSVSCHEVEMASLEDEVASEERDVYDKDGIVRET